MLSIFEDLLKDANSFCRKACLQVEEEYFRNELLSKDGLGLQYNTGGLVL
jgi:hypothetical protein